MKSKIVILFLSMLLSATSLYSFEKSRLLFYYVKVSENVSEEHRSNLMQSMRNAIRDHPKFELVNDEIIATVFRRNGISEDGCTTTACAVKVGNDENLAAQYVMYADINFTQDGLFLINASVVDVRTESIFWQPVSIYRTETDLKFSSIAYSMIREFGDGIPVEPSVSKVVDGGINIDIGSDLGIRKGDRFNVVYEIQYDADGLEVDRDTLGVVEVMIVLEDASQAKVISQKKDMQKGAKLYELKEEIDAMPPIIQHEINTIAAKFLDFPIRAEVSDNKKLSSVNVYLTKSYYESFQKFQLVKDEKTKNDYIVTIPTSFYRDLSEFYYYIEAVDESGNTRLLKTENDLPFRVVVTDADKEPPVISFDQPEEKANTNELTFTANVKDDIRVKDVFIHYRFRKNIPFIKKQMSLFAKDIYGVGIDISQMEDTRLWYYLEAFDYYGNRSWVGEIASPIECVVASRDVMPPKMHHVSKLTKMSDGSFYIKANVEDNIRVSQVSLIFSLLGKDGKQEFTENLVSKGNGWFDKKLFLNFDGYNQIEYKVEACDDKFNCSQSNTIRERVGTQNKKYIADRKKPVIKHFYPRQQGMRPNNYVIGGNLFYTVIMVVEDNVDVDRVSVYYRNIGSTVYHKKDILKLSKRNDWGDLIIGSDVGIEYYIVASDFNNNEDHIGLPHDPERIYIGQNRGKMASLPSRFSRMTQKKDEQ